MPIPDDPFEDDGTHGRILTEVELDFFRANPTTIGPFGASTLTWKVRGPAGFDVQVDRQPVRRTGQLSVQPTSDRTYTLFARAGVLRKALAQVRVEVDRAGCASGEVERIAVLIGNLLRTTIENDPELRFRPVRQGQSVPPLPGGPIVELTAGRIAFTLRLAKSIDYGTATIDIEGRLGLDVIEGTVVPKDSDVDADVRVPFYFWLVPGAVVALPPILSNAKVEARAAGQRIVDGIARLMDAYAASGPGRRVRSVRILPGGAGEGTLVVEHCADTLLQFLAQHSGTLTADG